MTNTVVNVNVNLEVAPAPSTLQKTGAFISSGGTITSPGTKSLLTQLSDLTPLLVQPAALSSLSYAGGLVSATTSAPHGYNIGDTINLTIAGAAPSGYNGTYPCTITSSNSFTYSLLVSPGAETTPGTYVPAEANSLVERATTFFAQGSAQSVYVLEVGAGTATEGVTFLQNWIASNPGVFYSYLVPRFWDANATLIAFAKTLEGNGAKTYFFVTTTLATYQLYAGIKSIVWLIEAPVYGAWPQNALQGLNWSGGQVTATTTTAHGVLPGQWFQIQGCTPTAYNGWWLAQPGTTGETLVWNLATNPGAESALGVLEQSQYASAGISSEEFSLAALFRITLNYAPSSTNKVTPLNNAFVFGVTPFPAQANSALISTLLTANGNLIGTGAAGGISEATVSGGTMADGNPFKYWYSIDWVQINLSQAIWAALINGANNPANPLDYNQFGIDALQQVCVTTMTQGVNSGLVLNQVKGTTLTAAALQQALDVGTYAGITLVNADPFFDYTTLNPNDYQNGVYNGLYVRYAPQRDFNSITVNVTVTNFAQ